MAVEIECCRSVAYADAVKALFARNHRPGFGAYFDRVYPAAFAAGGMAWVARNAEGVVVGHGSALPRDFSGAGGTTRGILAGDFLFDRPYRDFRSPLALLQQAIIDAKREGFGFAYSDPSPRARPVMEHAGFTRVGSFERFMTPLASPYRSLFRIWTRVQPLLPAAGYTDGPSTAGGACQQPESLFCPRRTPDFYSVRYDGFSAMDSFLSLRRARDAEADACAWAVVARGECHGLLQLLDVRWDDRRATPEAVVAGIARAAREAGYAKLSTLTLSRSAFSSALRRSGFIPRGDGLPVYVLNLGVRLPASTAWLLMSCDGSGW